MQLYLFLIIGALLVVKPTINALFLSTAGADDLSFAFILTAIIAVIISFSYHKLLERFSLKLIIKSTLWFFAICFFLIGILVLLNVSNIFLVYTFYLFVGIYALLVTSQFWVLANVVFNIREAKRLFGFIGAGGIAGGIAGGYLTSILVPWTGNGLLIIMASLMILSCSFIYRKIRKLSHKGKVKFDVRKREEVSKTPSIQLILDSKHLTYLAGVIGIGVIVAKLVDYEFSYLASERIKDPMELASFFGFWFSTFNIISLALQLLVTKKFLEHFNVDTNLMILPVGIIACALLLFLVPELWLVVILKGLDGSLKQSLHKSALELLALPIPSDIKNKTKTFIDVVVDSLATGMAGLIIIFVIKGLDLPNYVITISIVVLSIVWIALVFKVKGTYLSIFKHSIEKREKLQKVKTNYATLLSNMKIIFETGGSEDIITMLNKIPDLDATAIKNQVVDLLNHPDDKVKAAVINNIDYVSTKPIAEIQDFIYNENDALINASMRYLLRHEDISYQFFENYLDDEDESISTAALLALAQVSQDNPLLAEKYNLGLRIELFSNEIIGNELQTIEMCRLIEVLGYASTDNYNPIIKKFLNHPNIKLQSAAIKAAGHTKDFEFLSLLLGHLNNENLRKPLFKSIKKFGNRSIELIEQSFHKKNINSKHQVVLLNLLNHLKTKKATRSLLKLAQLCDISVKKQSFEMLFGLRKQESKSLLKKKKLMQLIDKESNLYKDLIRSYWSIKVLQRSIETTEGIVSLPEKNTLEKLLNSIDQCITDQLEIIFHLLSQQYNPEDVFVAYKGMTSEETVSRLHAMEYLNGILSRNLKNLLFPLFELESSTINSDSFEFQEKIKLFDRTRLIGKLLLIPEKAVLESTVQYLDFKNEKISVSILSNLPPYRAKVVSQAIQSFHQRKKNKIA